MLKRSANGKRPYLGSMGASGFPDGGLVTSRASFWWNSRARCSRCPTDLSFVLVLFRRVRL